MMTGATNKEVYLDNASTTRQKSESVLKAFTDYVTEIGVSPSRGTYPLAVEANRILHKTRALVANYFGGTDSDYVCFTKNSTEAINLFVRGYFKPGDHVLISPFEHNAVLRPLHEMMLEGVITYDVLPEDVIYGGDGIEKHIKSSTKAIFLTLASNLTGQIVFSRNLAERAERFGLKVFVDASQGAGKICLDMAKDHIDYIAFTGHKDLIGLPGVGGLCYKDELKISPLIQGGTGIRGDSYVNPTVYPDAYEAGTLNMPAIAAFRQAITEASSERNQRCATERSLMDYLMPRLGDISGIKIYNKDYDRISTVAFNVDGVNSDDVVAYLNHNGICVRGGIHCAILAHKTLGTVETGAVRVSLNYKNTVDEIDYFIEKMRMFSR